MNDNLIALPLSILIVEDNIYVASRLRIILSDVVNHQLLGIARNVTEALILIEEHIPQVAILDIHLDDETNGLNGIDLLRILRMEHPGIVIMMLSNFSDTIYRQKCMQLGADYFFDKTNDFDKIPGTLQRIQESF